MTSTSEVAPTTPKRMALPVLALRQLVIFPGSTLPIYDEFTLGGFGSLSGYADDQLRGQYLGLGRIGYYYNLFGGGWFLGGWAEAGNVWETSDEADFDNILFAGTVILARATSIGPLYLAYGRSDEGFSKVYFVLGRAF